MNSRTKPTWSDVKARLQEFDRTGLLTLIQDLYAASKDNQVFLHARYGLGEDVLKPYKQTIDRWLWPDMFKGQNTSVAKAKKAIADYKKAVGLPVGVAELTVYFCERGSGFAKDVGLQDEAYFQALVRMFEQALLATVALPGVQRAPFLARLMAIRDLGQDLDYGVGDEMGNLFAEHANRCGLSGSS
jgi:hypothetical protein